MKKEAGTYSSVNMEILLGTMSVALAFSSIKKKESPSLPESPKSKLLGSQKSAPFPSLLLFHEVPLSPAMFWQLRV